MGRRTFKNKTQVSIVQGIELFSPKERISVRFGVETNYERFFSMDIKEKKFEYDTLYNATIELLKGLNLCEFDESGLCKRSRNRLKNGFKQEEIIWCCCGPFNGTKQKIDKPCEKFIDGKGCGTCALNCKLWFCDQIVIPSDLAEKINIIKCIAEGKGFMIFRGDFDDYLKTLDEVEKKCDNKKKGIFFWKRG